MTARGGALGSTGVLLVMLLVWAASNLDQSLFSYAIPGIVGEFGASLNAIGGLLSLSFAVAAVFAVLAGMAADRFGRRWTLVVLLASSALFVGLHGYVQDMGQLTLARTLAFGLAAGIAPITAAYVAEAAPARHRGMLMGILQCGYPLGWAIGGLLAGQLLATGDWRNVFLVGFVMVPVALLMGRFLPESVRFAELAARTDAAAVAPVRLGELFAPVLRRRSLACIVLFFTFGGAYAGTAFFFATFFTEVRGYSPADAATLVGLGNGFAVAGYLVAAAVGEYLWTRRNTYALWCLLGAFALLALVWLPVERWQDLALFALTGSFFYGSNAVVGALLADLYPTRVRATAYAVCGSAPLSLGFAVYPAVVPLVVGVVGWKVAMSMAIAPLLVASALAALWLPNLQSGAEVADV
jgi:MFS family permease